MDGEEGWSGVREELNLIRSQLMEPGQRVESNAKRFWLSEPGNGEDQEEEMQKAPELPSEYFQFRKIEDGPKDIPEYLVDFATRRLPLCVDYPADRALRAWNQGHWAWAALRTHTLYKPLEQVPGEACHHWIVLRGPGVYQPFRTSNKNEACNHLGYIDGTQIMEGFKYFVELQIFCASIPVPVPRRMRSTIVPEV